MSQPTIQPATAKPYKCQRCGYITTQTTNHYGETYSWGQYSACPVCPPWAKYTHFGGSTIWECMVFKLYDREYKILATFPETSQDAANEFMAKTDGAALLAIANGKLYIADAKDEGLQIEQSQVAQKE